jgi:hypothetical protein
MGCEVDGRFSLLGSADGGGYCCFRSCLKLRTAISIATIVA